MVFTGLNQEIKNGTGASTDIVAMEEPVFTSDNEGFDGAFGEVVVDIESSIMEIAFESLPVS
jgi:hypothetical protein